MRQTNIAVSDSIGRQKKPRTLRIRGFLDQQQNYCALPWINSVATGFRYPNKPPLPWFGPAVK